MKTLIVSIVFSFTVNISLAQALQIDWQYCYGGSLGDGGKSIVKTGTGYTLLSSSKSNDGDASNNYGESDFWLINIDYNGNLDSKVIVVCSPGGEDTNWGKEDYYRGMKGKYPELFNLYTG